MEFKPPKFVVTITEDHLSLHCKEDPYKTAAQPPDAKFPLRDKA